MKAPRTSWRRIWLLLIGVAALVTVTIVLAQVLRSTFRLQPQLAATAQFASATLAPAPQLTLSPTPYPLDRLAKTQTPEAATPPRESYPGPSSLTARPILVQPLADLHHLLQRRLLRGRYSRPLFCLAHGVWPISLVGLAARRLRQLGTHLNQLMKFSVRTRYAYIEAVIIIL